MSGVEVNQGAALFQRLREKNYGIAEHSLPNVKSAFFNPTIFRQARYTSIESWCAKVRFIGSLLRENGQDISEADQSRALRLGVLNADLMKDLTKQEGTFEETAARAVKLTLELYSTATTGSVWAITDTSRHSDTADQSSSGSPCAVCFKFTGRKLMHAVEKCNRLKQMASNVHDNQDRTRNEKRAFYDENEIVCYRCGSLGHKSPDCTKEPTPPPDRGGGRGGHNAGRGFAGRGSAGRSYYQGNRARGGNARHVSFASADDTPIPHDNPAPPCNYVPYDDSAHFSSHNDFSSGSSYASTG